MSVMIWPLAKKLALFLLLFSTSQIFAQNDSIPPFAGGQLKTIEINSTPIRNSMSGERSEQWETADEAVDKSSNLGDFLSKESGVFMKNYGLGSSATSSIRGGSAGHTAIIWNGFPIQNSMLGQLDFSLVPVGFTDHIRIAYGGSSSNWGSGAIGGTVFLQNQAYREKGFSINVRSEIGSFGWLDQQVSLKYGHKKWSSSTRFFHQEAENDFSYSIRPDLPEKKQSNAAVNQKGLLQEIYWTPNSNEEFSLRAWAQMTDRQIPPTSTQTRSEAHQKDEFIRAALNWKRMGDQSLWQLKAGLFRENQAYQDPVILLEAFNNFWKAFGETVFQLNLKENQKLQAGLNHTWIQAESKSYAAANSQNRTAGFAMFRQEWKQLAVQFNLRQELVDGKFVPLVPGLGIDVPISNWLTWQSKITRNFRLPTLNDLYWQPGGNPSLEPEKGWSEEIGLKSHFEKNKLSANFSATVFNRNIRNWIQWSIAEGQQFYSANNITKVWSRGLEQRFDLAFENENLKWTIRLGYDFIKSTYQEAIEAPKFDKGAQLVYVPKHQAFGKFTLEWKSFTFQYRHRYTGAVNALNLGALANYQTASTYLSYEKKGKKMDVRLFFKTENLWNANYRIIERRPMPGRYFRLGINLHTIIFKKK